LNAARRFGIPAERWLDLSTGINPLGWPVPASPAECWRRLPEADDGLIETAGRYYGSGSLLPVAGSQAALQALPLLRRPCRVGVLAPGYGEHARAWERCGHAVARLSVAGIDAALDGLDVLVVINPNNPTGEVFAPATLSEWQHRLAARDGWLVVDEAFMDATPELSLAPRAGTRGLVVLRSLGKFFGLAGARVGFVLAWQELLSRLEDRLGPWAVSGPARWVAARALADFGWQEEARKRLRRDAGRLGRLLGGHGLLPAGGTALFQWVPTGEASAVHQSLARRGILVRRFDAPSSLRFGLPGEEAEWRRLEEAVSDTVSRRSP
jgi:cobalamin biosynthetic protein CobC